MILKTAVNILNYIVLILAAAIAFYYGAGVLDQPFAIARISAFLPMLLALFVFFNRLFSLILLKVDARNYRFVLFTGKWLLTLFLPMLIASHINEAANIKSEQIVTSTFEKLISHLDNARQTKQIPPDDILVFLHKSNMTRSFNYYSGPEEFMLTTGGGSIDIDGSTLFYHSDNQQWRYVHNDLLQSESGRNTNKLFRRVNKTLQKRSFVFERQKTRWSQSS